LPVKIAYLTYWDKKSNEEIESDGRGGEKGRLRVHTGEEEKRINFLSLKYIRPEKYGIIQRL
jgi:hypothetical protein